MCSHASVPRLSAYAFGTGTELWFGHACSGDRLLLEHEPYYGLGMYEGEASSVRSNLRRVCAPNASSVRSSVCFEAELRGRTHDLGC